MTVVVPSAPLPIVDSLRELAQMVRTHPGAHVRFSHGPADDSGRTSRDYESGLDLPGLSSNPLAPEAWWTRPLEDWLARQLCQYEHLAEQSDDERHAWVLEGQIIARGPDCEPLLTDARPLARVGERCIAEAKRRYAERFDIGRDST